MTIATMMRVKNEATYIKHALESLRELDGPIFVLDDGSTDGTSEICLDFDGDIYYEKQEGMPMDEGRDRTLLYKWALEVEPDWCFTLDGDEVLDEGTGAHMLRAIKNCPEDVNVFEMFLAVMQSPVDAKEHMWLGPLQPQGAWSMDRMFRVTDADKDHEFRSNCPGNLHCGCTPTMTSLKREKLNAWIRYYGYESEEARSRKQDFYSAHDPVNFPNTSRLWESRRPLPAIRLPRPIDCRELGITKTASY